ncbi:MAG: M50 family metallopeptidase [Chloroflexota bacterium]
MIDGLISVVILLAILVGLVVIHELGHFVAARRANVRVHEFGVGFPPRALVLHRGRETIVSLNWLPIGGFVRLEAEEGESADPRAFVNARLPTRIAILLAGVLVNLVFAWLLFTLIAFLGDPSVEARIRSVVPDSPAAAVGIRGDTQTGTDAEGQPVYAEDGDRIVAIDGVRFAFFDHIETMVSSTPQGAVLRANAGRSVVLTLAHADGTVTDVPVTLRPPAEAEKGALGVTFAALPLGEPIARSPLEAAAIGFDRLLDASTLLLRGVGELIANLADPQVSGPVGMVASVDVLRTEWPPVFLVWFVALLSANLGVINLLPFPPMDGGRIAMALAIRAAGGRITPALERGVYLTGFLVLMGLLAWITFTDLRRLGGG